MMTPYRLAVLGSIPKEREEELAGLIIQATKDALDKVEGVEVSATYFQAGVGHVNFVNHTQQAQQ